MFNRKPQLILNKDDVDLLLAMVSTMSDSSIEAAFKDEHHREVKIMRDRIKAVVDTQNFTLRIVT